MPMRCDVCKAEVPDGTRFCPSCGLEIVPERERASRPPPLNKDVFDWDEDPNQPKDYAVSKQQRPRLSADKLAEMLKQAETRLADGYVLETAALLNQIRPQVARHANLRPPFEQLFTVIEDRKNAICDRCRSLAQRGDSDRLVALLVGPAANDLGPEEICSIALDAARTLYAARQADAAGEVLRIPPFRTLRDERLMLEHRDLEALVSRRRYWQHWRRSLSVLGGTCILGGLGLTLWAWFLWRTGLGAARRYFVPGLLLCAILLISLPQWKPKLEKWLREYFEDESPGEKLKRFWRKLGK